MFWSNSFCKNYKRITLQSKVLGLFSRKKGHASGSNIAKKIFWWNYFCNPFKKYYERKCSKELFCNNFGQGSNDVDDRSDDKDLCFERRCMLHKTSTGGAAMYSRARYSVNTLAMDLRIIGRGVVASSCRLGTDRLLSASCSWFGYCELAKTISEWQVQGEVAPCGGANTVLFGKNAFPLLL